MAEIKHGTVYGYRKQGCRLDCCRSAHNAKQREYESARRDKINATERAWYQEKHKRDLRTPGNLGKIVQADILLREGASYAETARTIKVSPDTVARWFPGRGWTSRQATDYATLRYRYRKII